MALTLVPVTGHVSNPDGTDAAGVDVAFKANAQTVNSGDRVVLQKTVTFATDSTGRLPSSAALYATDDPGVQPDGLAYTVTIRGTGNDRSPLYLSVTHTATSVDISSATPQAPAASSQAFASQHGLNAEIARAEAAESAETARAETAEAAEAAARADGDTATLAAATGYADAADQVILQAAKDYTDGAESDTPFVQDMGGTPTFVSAAAFDLETGDPYTDPIAIPADPTAVTVTVDGEVLLVLRNEDPLATVAYADATQTAAEAYSDLELSVHAAAADPHPGYALDADVTTEAAARATADTANSTAITTETTRATAAEQTNAAAIAAIPDPIVTALIYGGI